MDVDGDRWCPGRPGQDPERDVDVIALRRRLLTLQLLEKELEMLGRLLTDAGFTVTRRLVHPVLNAGYDASTFSAGVIGLIADFVPGRAGVTDAEAQAWRADLVGLSADYFFSLNRYLFLAVKPG